MLPSPSDDRVGDLSSWFSKLNTLPVAAPVYASDRISRCVPQDSGSGWIRCSFPVGLFHSLLHAGLSRRTACPTGLDAESTSCGWVSGEKTKNTLIDAGRLSAALGGTPGGPPRIQLGRH